MDDIYTNLENYDDFNKLEELQNENKTLKYKIEEYTSAINKLQKDFDMLAVEHKKLELNYSSLLKTAKAEIERKTHMIKELNIEKDKLIINARQTINLKSNFNKFHSDRFNPKSNISSDNSSMQEQPQVLNPNIQVSHSEHKNNNSSPLDTTSTCSGDMRDLNDAACSASKNIKHDKTSFICKENSIQTSNNLSNRQTETKVKKIMNRRKSMPVSSCCDVNYSSDDERESSVTTKTNKTQYPTREEIKRSTDRYYQNHKTYETSSLENNCTPHQDLISNYSRNKSYYYSDNNYRGRDSYDSSQRRRWNISPDRSNRCGRDYTDNYYQTYNNRRGHESPSREKSYHQSRSGDRRYNYRRDRSRDYLRSNKDTDRYAEKHRLQDVEEPSYKRQKYEHSSRYSEDDGRQREKSASRAALPTLLDISVSCQSPDYIHPDNHISIAPIREIRSTAVMHLEDPRLSSKKYKIITDCDKEILTTVIGRNIDITPVNKKLWGFNPIPMPKALIEPPFSYTDNVNKNFNMDIGYSSHSMFDDSNEMSNQTTNSEHCFANESADLNSNSKDVITNSAAPVNKETQVKCSKTNQTTVNMDSKSQSIKEKNDDKVSAKQLSSGYKIPKKQNSSEVLTNNETLSNNKISNLNSKEKYCISPQGIPQPIDSKCSTLSNNIKINTRGTQKDDNCSLEKRLTEDEDAEKFIENKDHDLAMSRKIVESDLTLSDDTSDNFEPPLTIIETQTKSKCKKYKTKESSEKYKGILDMKKSESSSETLKDASTVEEKEKRPSEEDKIKRKGESTEHTKKQKHKKKSQEGKDCDVDDSKNSKIKKAKKEKETKTTEIKTKFSELFGDSSSLITCDDLGVVSREPEHGSNFDTIIEDTQDAVDINIKEIEKLQPSKLKPDIAQNESVGEQADKQTAPVSRIDNVSNANKKCDDLKISIRKKEDKYSIVNEATEPVIFSKNINSEVSNNIPKTVIISTGMQPQKTFNNDVEFRQPMNVTSVEKVVQPFLSPGLEALATSTPAKTERDQSQRESITTHSDCSSVSSTDVRIVNLPQTKNQLSDTEPQRDSDVPDVRIFVKRRRKAKKIIP